MGCNTFALSAYIAFCRVATPVWHTFDQCSISSYLEAFSSQGKCAEVNIWKVLGRQKPLAQLKLLRRGTKDLQSYSYARMTAQIEIEVCSCMAWRACHGFSSVRLFVVQNRARCPPFVHSWKSTTWGVILCFLILHVFLHFYGLWTNSDNEVLLSNVGHLGTQQFSTNSVRS